MINENILSKLSEITDEEQKILDGLDFIDRTLYMENNKNVINSKKMLGRGEYFTARTHTRFIRFPKHSHDYVEVIYMCKGKTTHIIDGEMVELSEGELLFLCQSANQEILPAGKDDIAVNFIILPEFFDRALQMIDNHDAPLFKFVIDCLKNSDRGLKYLHFKVADVRSIQNLAENLVLSIFSKTEDSGNINRFTMGLLLLELINHSERLVSKDCDDRFVVKVLSYIEENYKDGSLSELSGILHYDVSTLSREIKSKTGKNFTDLIQEKRLSKACFLLKNTSLSVDETAILTGYENISFFHRLFKKYYGVSPRKYRMDIK